MKYFFAFSILLSIVFVVRAQQASVEKASPLDMTTMRYKNTYVKITYGRPQKRGREIFGSLVPYGEVWRTGANQATEITLTGDVMVNANLLAAGTYSIFTIPDKVKWTVIVNRDVGLWGAYNYNPKRDVFRFDVPVQQVDNEGYEAFTIELDAQNDKADLIMAWDQVKVVVPIRFAE